VNDDERRELEARLTRTLKAVARTVPDEPPVRDTRHAGGPRDRTVRHPRRQPSPTVPPGTPTIAFEDEPVPSRHRRARVGAALAAVAAAAVVVGMLVAGSGDHEPRVQLGAGSTTTAAPTVPTTPTTTAADGLVAVPNVVGMRFSEASLSLSRVGLQAVFRYEASARPAGEVTGWEPADGRVPPGSTITLVVSG